MRRFTVSPVMLNPCGATHRSIVSGPSYSCTTTWAFKPGQPVVCARAVSDSSMEAGKAAARLCALNVLSQLEAAVGDLDRALEQCVRLGGFINAAPGFSAVAGVMNGASDLMVELLGNAGRHARSTVGVAELPLDAAVEVEAMFEVR